MASLERGLSSDRRVSRNRHRGRKLATEGFQK